MTGSCAKRHGGKGGHGFAHLAASVVLACFGLAALAPQAQALSRASVPKFYLKKPARGTLMDVLARRIVFDARRDVATALGDVRITYGPYVLVARKVVYDRRKDKISADGYVEVHEPDGNILFADFAQFDHAFRDGFARHLRLLMTNSATMKARYAVRKSGYLTTYYDVRYTRCSVCKLDDGSPLWELKSERAIHDARKGRIYHKNMTLELGGVPIFWTPYLSHPDPKHPRASGFLVPNASYSSQLGFGFGIPYFINLAPNYDITLRPMVYSKQGLLARATWRHRVASGTYKVDFGGIRQLQPKKVAPPGDRKWRGFVRGTGQFALNSRWRWGFDGAMQTDRTMMRRYGIDKRDTIESKLWLTGLDGRNYFHARASHFRGLLDVDNSSTAPVMAPYVHYSHTFADAIAQGELIFDSRIYSIYRQDAHTPFTGVHQGTRQTRSVMQLAWQRRMVSSAGIVAAPFARLRADIYATSNVPDPAAPGGQRGSEVTSRFLPSAGLDVRWPFMRQDDLGQHVFSPVAQVMAARDEVKRARIGNEDSISMNFTANNLFLHDRFSGLDRYEGGVRANIGLLYSLYMPSGGFVRASIGQSYHLAGRNSFGIRTGLGRDYSDVVAAIAYAPNDNLRISWQGRFDGKSLSLSNQEVNASASYMGLTAAVQYARLQADPAHGLLTRQEQIAAAASWNFSGNWRLFGGWRYDLASKSNVRRSIGIGYECDCFNFSFEYVQNFTSNADDISKNAFFLTVEFKTLGGGTVGGNVF